MDISFSGAGFMGTYYIGVLDCWTRFVPRGRVNRTAGASAGSLTAAYYLMDEPWERCLFEIGGLIEGVRQRPLGVFDRKHQIVDLLPIVLNKLFPEDAHKRASGRLFVAMTRLKDMKKVIVSEFDSKKDLIDALNCSCFIPLWSGNHVSTYKGDKHIDGGFSDNLPVFDEHTIRICCFSGESDISPNDRSRLKLLAANVVNTPVNFNFQNFKRLGKALFPPTPTYILQLLCRGFHDTREFLLANDLIQCDECYRNTELEDQPIYALERPMITPRISPTPSRANSVSAKSRLELDLKSVNKSEALLSVSGKKQQPPTTTTTTTSSGNSTEPQQAPTTTTTTKGKDAKKALTFAQLLKRKLSTLSVVDQNEKHALNANTPDIDFGDANRVGFGKNLPAIITSEHCDGEFADELREPLADLNNNLVSRITSTNIAANKDNKDSSGHNKKQIDEQIKIAAARADASRALARRRSSLATPKLPKGLAIESKFSFAETSCPPSPSLNRTCAECSRLRQAARLAKLSDELVAVAQKFEAEMQPRSQLLRGPKLAKRARYLRSVLKKSFSYKPQAASIPT